MKRKVSPKHYKEDKFDTKRAVLSYEQLPLDDYNQTAGKDKKETEKKELNYKRIIIALMVIVLLVAIVFAFFNRFSCAGCSTYNYNSSQFPLNLKGSLVSNGNFETFDGGFSYVSDTHYSVYDSAGNELLSSQVAFNDPILKLNYNGSAIIYDLGGNDYSVYSSSELLFNGETDTTMYLADVTAEYAFATVTESRDYKAKLSVYNASGEPLYAYYFEEYYITSMSLNSNATGAVACGISAEGGIEKSVVYVFDFTEETPVAFYELSDEIAFDCDYLADNSICVVGENASYVLSSRNFEKLTKNSYSQMVLTSYDINSDTGVLSLSLSRSGDGRNCTVQCINTSGKIEYRIETDKMASYLSTYKNRVAISDCKYIYLYTQSGELLSEISVSGDSRQIRLCASDAAIALGLKDIALYRF